MDLQMPVMDGYSASRHIREFNNAIPIIALTASAASDISQRTREYGINDYLLKPIKPVELYDIIYKYTHQRKAS
jgi:CheY-like chemotaxis protein